MASAPERFQQVAIRLLGSFNPAILTPDWLLSKHLIDEGDRDFVAEKGADRMIVSTVWSGGRYAWVTLETSRELMTLASTPATETGQRIRELAVGLLEALPETPVGRVHLAHAFFVAPGDDRWHRLSELVAPTTDLGSSFPDAELVTLVHRADREGGWAQLTIEPSRVEEFEIFDMFVELERVWALAEPPGVDPARAVRVLDQEWDSTETEAGVIVDHLLALT